ncbi:MAG: hypothetical protein CMN99_06915 [Synechococcus sp. RS344]|nr:hypothetical protein [Synechococcus sp. RS344]
MARLLWLLPVGLLQACAGTPVAEQLERSFAVPEARPAQAAAPVPVVKTSPTVVSPTVVSPSVASPTAEGLSTPAAEAVSLPEATDAPDPVPQPKPRTVSSQRLPQAPYRITIRLAGADPAAPAEAVTRALREADVGFAVERIERVEP